MMLGALLDAGLPEALLGSELGKLPLPGYRLEVQQAKRGGLSGTLVHVSVAPGQPMRNLKDILDLIESSSLSASIREKSKAIFESLGEVEAAIHGTDLASVHFHEVGAVDSIVDIVGAVIGVEYLGIERMSASPVNLGSGSVRSAHGTLPVPAPATAALLKGRPVYSAGAPLELTTPTGAALLVGFDCDFGVLPPMRLDRIGYGLGSQDPSGWSNVLRLFIGEQAPDQRETCWLIETNIDDMNPEFYGHLMDRLLVEGALDVFFTPIVMKKSRPGTRVGVLSPEGREEALSRVLFLETTAIGLRRHRVERDTLERKIIPVQTPYGEVPVKLGLLDGEVVNRAPEYEACRRLAAEKGVALKTVYIEALRASGGAR
jgi:uncharacterized protein (TIGR00299 family) protein